MHFGPGPNKLLSNGSLKQVFSAAMDLFLHLSGAGGIALLLKDGEGNYRTHLSRAPSWLPLIAGTLNCLWIILPRIWKSRG